MNDKNEQEIQNLNNTIRPSILIQDNEVNAVLNVDNSNKRKKIIIFFVLFVVILIGFGTYFILSNSSLKEKEEKEQTVIEEQNKTLSFESEARYYLDSLYLMDAPKNFITDEEYVEAMNKIALLDDDAKKDEFTNEVEEMKKFTELEEIIRKLYVNKVLISNYTKADMESANEIYNSLKDEWKHWFTKDIAEIEKQSLNIENVDNAVKKFFTDESLKTVKNNVTRDEYNEVLNLVKTLPQTDLVNKYNDYLSKVLSKIEGKEKAAAVSKLQAEINKAWVILETPYISQNKNKIYNACEVASLLMGLQYKGYLKNVSLKKISDDVPKTNDPHTGFFRDIYGTEPKNLPHWMAPDALAKFGREYSGNPNVIDITGSSVYGLKKELNNDNPVIIYATGSNFADPKNWIEEVPNNVHVMLLIGYNDKTKQMLIHDPWTRNGTGKVYISESRFTEIYNKIGKKAVVIG